MNRLCPMCGNKTEQARCPKDGTATLVLAQNPDSRLSEGTEINGRYRIGQAIGQGGFGAVYRATSLATGQTMAVKVLGISLDSDESELIQRFFAEAQITASLKHPNTIRVFDFGQTEGGALYIAMELLSGQDLNELLRERRHAGTALTQAETSRIAAQSLRSLTEAHMSGLVHRDLKPHNIFLNDVPGDDPIVKVLDFGIAKRLGSNLTGTGQAFGTPNYMSPEQAQNRPIDARSDLYSLGVVLYQCVAGACPFEGDNPLAVLLSHVTDKPEDLYARAKHPVSREFAAVIERSLAKDPNDRFADAIEMRRALEGCPPAPSEAQWKSGEAEPQPADPSGTPDAPVDDRTAAYAPIAVGDGPVHVVPPKNATPAAEPEGGSGYTQAFLDRGLADEVAAVLSAKSAGESTGEQDEPLPKPRSAAWMALPLLLLAAGAGLWFFLGGTSSQANVAVASDAGLSTDASAAVTGVDAGQPPDAGASLAADSVGQDAAQALDASGDTQVASLTTIALKTQPPGAQVRIDGKVVGKTPLPLQLANDGTLRATLSRAGYRDKEVVLVKSDAPARTVSLTKVPRVRKPRPVKRPKPPPRKVRPPKVKSALEERL